MPNLAGLFDCRTEPTNIPDILDRFATVLSLSGFTYERRQWHDDRFGAVNLLNDLAGCREQPALSADGRRVLFLDGEVYNLDDLVGLVTPPGAGAPHLTPCQVCLALYDRFGPTEFVTRLNGQFNIAVYDAAAQTLRVYNDHLADRPLYYLHRDGVLYFALEQKALLAAPGVAPRQDEQAVTELLAFGHFLGDRTLFEGVAALPQGSVLTADRSGVRVEPYWRPAFPPARFSGTLREAAAEYGRRVVAATARRARAGRGLGIFLSGGLDSRFVAGALARASTDVTAFSFGPEDSNDARFGRELAARLGFRHLWLPEPGAGFDPAVLFRCVWRNECTVPFTDSTSIEHHPNIQRAARTIFNGHLGDALSGGHLLPQLFLVRDRDQLAAHILTKRTALNPARLQRLYRAEALAPAHDRLRDTVRALLHGLNEPRIPELYVLWDLTVRQRRYTLPTPAVDRYLLEQLSPFLDNEVHEFALTLPIRWLFGQRCYIRAILNEFPEIARTPWARTGRPIESHFGVRLAKLGRDYLWRRVRKVRPPARRGAPAPDGGRLRGRPLQEVLEGYLRSPAFPDRLLDPARVRGLIESHFEQGNRHDAEVSVLLTLAAGARLFLERPVRACPDDALPPGAG